MSDRSAKRRKTSAMAAGSAPAFETLPRELLETIFGLLDVRTLCTVRLVCAQFHTAASLRLYSVQLSAEILRSRPETTLSSFPNLSRVTVFDVKEDDLLILARSPLADAVTHVRAVKYLSQVPQRGQIGACSPLLPLPNLMSLTVSHGFGHAFPFPQTLRELSLEAAVTGQTANLVTGLANLTCLRIDVSILRKPFEAVTALTALQRLEITCSLTHIPLMAELTLLTHLQLTDHWAGGQMEWEAAPGTQTPLGLVLASLTRLQRLVHLGIGCLMANLQLQLLSSIGTLTSLRSLDLELCGRTQGSASATTCMTPFSQLTALRLEGWGLDTSLLLSFNLERLQDLSLSDGVKLYRHGVAALRQATGLTHLELWKVGTRVRPGALGAVLARMPGLRALSLGTTARFQATFCSKVIGPLTELTRLKLTGEGDTTNADAQVCLGLRKLHVLSILVRNNYAVAPCDRLTPETLFALAKLPELRKMDTTGNFRMWPGALRDNVRAWADAERHEKGWPPLELNISA